MASYAVDLPAVASTLALGKCLGQRLVAGDALALCGELGAGKTTLVRGLAEGLELDAPEDVCSPTYLLVIEHPGAVPLLHVDAYLQDKTRAFLEDGGVDYLNEVGGVIVVEWADRIADLLSMRTLWLTLQPMSGGGRRAVLEERNTHFQWLRDLPQSLVEIG